MHFKDHASLLNSVFFEEEARYIDEEWRNNRDDTHEDRIIKIWKPVPWSEKQNKPDNHECYTQKFQKIFMAHKRQLISRQTIVYLFYFYGKLGVSKNSLPITS